MVGQFLERQSEMEQRQHAEAVLNESELRLQATFDLAAVGIVHTSLDGRYLRVNRQFCAMLGYSAAELVGRNGSEISHPDDALIGVGYRERMLKGELETFSQERRYICKDGRTIWTNRRVSLARDAAGQPLYFIRVIEDVTARKEVEERDRATFDNAPVGILHTSLDGYRILRANRKLCEMLGYTQDELLGATSTVLVHPDYRYKDHSLYAQQLLCGEIQSYASERKFLRKDGSSLWVNRTVSLVRDASGVPLYFIRVVEGCERAQARGAGGRARAHSPAHDHRCHPRADPRQGQRRQIPARQPRMARRARHSGWQRGRYDCQRLLSRCRGREYGRAGRAGHAHRRAAGRFRAAHRPAESRGRGHADPVALHHQGPAARSDRGRSSASRA
jgi:PAS domain S-box-containing protein